jgi:hypothetical protein
MWIRRSLCACRRLCRRCHRARRHWVAYVKSSCTLVNAFSFTAEDPTWAHFAGGSANGSKYTIVNSAMTFYGAQEECRKLGGYLAHVNTIREQVFLMDYLHIMLLNPG